MKKTILFYLLVCTAFIAKAQDDQDRNEGERGFKKENVFVGGNVGLSFGNTLTTLSISPQVGYRFTKLFAAGIGINGQYVSYKSYDFNGDAFKERQGVAGLNVFGRLYPVQQLFLQVQPEANYLFGKRIYYQEDPKQEYKLDAVIAPSFLVGAGAILAPNGRSGPVISIMYDVLQHENSPYGNKPIYNVGFNIGL